MVAPNQIRPSHTSTHTSTTAANTTIGAVKTAAILKVSQVFRNSGAEPINAHAHGASARASEATSVCVECVACGAAMPPLFLYRCVFDGVE